MSTKVKPLGTKVFIKRDAQKDITDSGLIIPTTAREQQYSGEVVAVGPGYKFPNGTIVPLEVKEGDKVLFGKYTGQEVLIDGQALLMVEEIEIQAVIN